MKISVRSLAEFYCEGGDLVSGGGAVQRMLEGAQGHRMVQSALPQGWLCEQSIRTTMHVSGLDVTLYGRMDALLPGDVPLVEEIKTTLEPISAMTGSEHPAHWAQAITYAAMLAHNEGCDRVKVRLHYLNLQGDEACFTREYTSAQLSGLLSEYMAPMLRWLKAVQAGQEPRRAALAGMAFPYDAWRPGQRDMAANVYVAVRDRRSILCQAPTGIGKTAAALYPALVALGQGKAGRVFYLTARTTGRDAALKALDLMAKAGTNARCVVVTAKDTICPMPERDCRPQVCPRARGYFDRRRDALYQSLGTDRLDRQAIEQLAGAHELCPFELSLDLCETADVILCDYNYAFDPRVRLERFFQSRSDACLLVDEAHNLPARARDMLSASLDGKALLLLRRDVGREAGRKHPLYAALNGLCHALNDLRGTLTADEAETGGARTNISDAVTQAARELVQAASAAFDERSWLCGQALSQAFFQAVDFVRAADAFDDRYRMLISPQGGKTCLCRLWCADSSGHIAGVLKRVGGAALFSATLMPMTFYRDQLGLSGEKDALLDLPSPFPPENMLTLVYPVPLRYSQRQMSLDRLCDGLKAFLTAGDVGNYLICFPSYAFMRMVLEHTDWPVNVMAQQRDMDDESRQAFLDALTPNPSDTTAAFIVLGGAFAEGVDLPGGRIRGAAIVGTGVPQLNLEGDTLRDVYQSAFGAGYDYAYRYPGMSKVLQAAGRVIRSERDRGCVLLMDSRFAQEDHRRLMPPHWHPRTVRTPDDIRAAMMDFRNENHVN